MADLIIQYYNCSYDYTTSITDIVLIVSRIRVTCTIKEVHIILLYVVHSTTIVG